MKHELRSLCRRDPEVREAVGIIHEAAARAASENGNQWCAERYQRLASFMLNVMVEDE